MKEETTGSSPPGRSRPLLLVAGGVALVTIAYQTLSLPRMSADLLPLWLAGEAPWSGAPDQIYAPAGELFVMRAPEGWAESAAAIGYDGMLLPFVYPPLWAWVFGLLGQVADFQTVAAVATLVNPALLLGMGASAYRTVGGSMGAVGFVVVSQLLLYGTVVARDDLLQNQLHILVAFLTVLALERSRSGKLVTAGAALALAASLKLFPVVFALFWLARADRLALYSFVAFGAALGLGSIAVAGWPLHAAFLEQVRAISNTAFPSPFSFSFDAVLNRLAGAEATEVAIAFTSGETFGIFVAEKVPQAAVLARLVLLIVLAAFVVGTLRAPREARYTVLWPAALAMLPVFWPLAWGYYFIPALILAPALIDRLGAARRGVSSSLSRSQPRCRYGAMARCGTRAWTGSFWAPCCFSG